MADMYTVTELRDEPAYEGIPEWFWNELPENCPDCGELTVTNLALTELRCANPRCSGKVAIRTKRFLDDISVKDLGESGIQKSIEAEDFTNPFYMVLLAKGEDGSGKDPYPIYPGINADLNKRVCSQIMQAVYRGAKIGDIVTMLHIDGMGEGACRDLFKGCTDLESFFNKVIDPVNGRYFVQKALGIKEDTYSLRAIAVRDNLIEFEEDICDAVEVFGNVHFYQPDKDGVSSKVHLTGAYSDKVATTYAKTKKEFYNFIADNFPKFDIEWSSGITKESDFLINGTGMETGKTKKAEKYGIPIFGMQESISAEDEFIAYLEDKQADIEAAGNEVINF